MTTLGPLRSGYAEQVRLVHLIRVVLLLHLQTENFRLFLRKQTDKRQTFV
jgi:hypothetical protein